MNEQVKDGLKSIVGKKDVAAMLGCSVRQVDYLREKEGLPWVRVGSLVRFRVDAVERWLQENEQTRKKAC